MVEILSHAKKIQDAVPVAAGIVYQNKMITIAQNRSCGGIFHAEIIAINNAVNLLGTSNLLECDIYVSLEPCPMCLYAICLSKIRRLYFAAFDFQKGGVSCSNVLQFSNHKPEIIAGIMEKEASSLLVEFFAQKR